MKLQPSNARCDSTALPFGDAANLYNVGVNEFPPARSIDRLESGLLSATGQP